MIIAAKVAVLLLCFRLPKKNDLYLNFNVIYDFKTIISIMILCMLSDSVPVSAQLGYDVITIFSDNRNRKQRNLKLLFPDILQILCQKISINEYS